jgi:hypothetical protein
MLCHEDSYIIHESRNFKIPHLSKYKKGLYYFGTTLFSNLPPNIKILKRDINMFKPALREYFLPHSYTRKQLTLIINSQLL